MDATKDPINIAVNISAKIPELEIEFAKRIGSKKINKAATRFTPNFSIDFIIKSPLFQLVYR